MKLVFATHNRNKLKEVQLQLPENIQLLGLDDIGCFDDIPETAQTLEDNALMKARFVKARFGYDCFADDTGLEVEALNDAPGVLSARYAGEQKSDSDNIQKLLYELQKHTNQKARFRTAIALIIGEQEYFFEGICNGEITKKRMGNKGFGYDSVFRPEGFKQTFAEMEMNDKNKISHRGMAIQKLLQFLKQF